MAITQQITQDVIANKQFTERAKGYDQNEVDDFLDAICDEMDRQQEQMMRLQQQLKEAQAAAASARQAKPVSAPAAAPVSGDADSSIREVLVLAQRLKDETVAEAQEKAKKIIEDANAQAKARLEGLDEERDSLSRQVTALKQTVSDYRSKFAALLQAQQEALDKVADL